jgi:hypothetical protein
MKDLLGNELKPGDAVHVKYGNEWVGGVLVKVQNGGLSLGIANPTQKNGAPQLTADVIVLQVTIPLGGQPGQPQPFLVRLDAPNSVTQLIESQIKM